MVSRLIWAFVCAVVAAIALPAIARAAGPECIAPARQGGGFDLTCRLAQAGLGEDVGLRVTYMPGGVGAVAYNMVVAQRTAERDTIVAFSGGSLLNLAQGKFGKFSGREVRWIAAIGADYGMVAVRADAPYRSLQDLIGAVKKSPRKRVFGGGGTVGSQDWMKAAALLRMANVDHRAFPYVSFEGGGEASTALLSGHVQVYTGDVSEVGQLWREGRIRILAVLSDTRLAGEMASIPTAREQGYPLAWPTVRGFYMGPNVDPGDYERWVGRFREMLASEKFRDARLASALLPFDRTSDDLAQYVERSIAEYRELARTFGLAN